MQADKHSALETLLLKNASMTYGSKCESDDSVDAILLKNAHAGYALELSKHHGKMARRYRAVARACSD